MSKTVLPKNQSKVETQSSVVINFFEKTTVVNINKV